MVDIYKHNLLEKIRRRAEKVKSCNDWCDNALLMEEIKCLFNFLENNETTKSIVHQLISRTNYKKEMLKLFEDASRAFIPDSYIERAVFGYQLWKQLTICGHKNPKVIEIVKKYKTQLRFLASEQVNDLLVIIVFFFDPIIWYIEEAITEQLIFLHLLKKYKQKCEWFQRPQLNELANNQGISPSKQPEMRLHYHFFEYLHDLGHSFSFTPRTASGMPDLIEDQVGDERVIAEVKVYSGNKSNITKGFKQVYRYCHDYNQINGYLIVFNTTTDDLEIALSKNEMGVSYLEYGGKLLFIQTIDISMDRKTEKSEDH